MNEINGTFKNPYPYDEIRHIEMYPHKNSTGTWDVIDRHDDLAIPPTCSTLEEAWNRAIVLEKEKIKDITDKWRDRIRQERSMM